MTARQRCRLCPHRPRRAEPCLDAFQPGPQFAVDLAHRYAPTVARREGGEEGGGTPHHLLGVALPRAQRPMTAIEISP